MAGPTVRPSRGRPAALGVVLLLACAGARAGSLSVRDVDGSQWRVVEDPADEAQGYLLQRLRADGRPDPGFGRGGQRPASVSAANDAPTSLRVDADHRVWLAGASIAGAQPQAVVERFLPDGALDLHWGVQGKVQFNPGGLAVKPNDLLPLADGSVLVAGIAANVEPARAVVFHLKADGSLDTAFGTGGTWQRPGTAAGDGSTATSLAVSDAGAVAMAVVVHGEPPVAEIWALADTPPTLVASRPHDESGAAESLRVAWSGGRWVFDTAGGATGLVVPAFLGPHAGSAPAVGAAASDPGEGGFSPFAAVPPASVAASTGPADAPWPWDWIAGVAAIGVVLGGVLRRRARGAKSAAKAGVGRSV